MPRERHDYLTNETKDTLTDNVKAAAVGLDKSTSYLYKILREEAPDPFPEFDAFYEGLCSGGVPTEHYDRRLAYHREKHSRAGGDRQPGEAIQNQFHEFSRFVERFMQGISDGSLDLAETNDLLDILAVLKPLVDTSEKSLMAHRVKLEGEGERVRGRE